MTRNNEQESSMDVGDRGSNVILDESVWMESQSNIQENYPHQSGISLEVKHQGLSTEISLDFCGSNFQHAEKEIQKNSCKDAIQALVDIL